MDSALSKISLQPWRRVLPVAFTLPMVQAIRRNLKTQTRRLIPHVGGSFLGWVERPVYPLRNKETRRKAWFGVDTRTVGNGPQTSIEVAPRYRLGDVLYVCESYTYARHGSYEPIPRAEWGKIRAATDAWVVYRADYVNGSSSDYDGHWQGGRFMRRCMAREWLEVMNVEPQRVQDITEYDAIQEGMAIFGLSGASGLPLIHRAEFVKLWHKIHKQAPVASQWEANPWIWKYSFRRITL